MVRESKARRAYLDKRARLLAGREADSLPALLQDLLEAYTAAVSRAIMNDEGLYGAEYAAEQADLAWEVHTYRARIARLSGQAPPVPPTYWEHIDVVVAEIAGHPDVVAALTPVTSDQ